MYMKIWGLKQLEKMGFIVPPYQVIAINEDQPDNLESYILEKIRRVGIPNIKNDRVGVTIRVSMLGSLDKRSSHGGLHVTDEKEVLRRVILKHEQYKPLEKIIIQHTVDAKYSGVTMKNDREIVIEGIRGDAPALLEGETSNFESWIYVIDEAKLSRNRAYIEDNEEIQLLSENELSALINKAKNFNENIYLEWSIAKNGRIYYYEYLELP